jgi:hypothetical protein
MENSEVNQTLQNFRGWVVKVYYTLLSSKYYIPIPLWSDGHPDAPQGNFCFDNQLNINNINIKLI